jgi:hypothetical protein
MDHHDQHCRGRVEKLKQQTPNQDSTMIRQLTLFKGIIAVYSENHKHEHTLGKMQSH